MGGAYGRLGIKVAHEYPEEEQDDQAVRQHDPVIVDVVGEKLVAGDADHQRRDQAHREVLAARIRGDGKRCDQCHDADNCADIEQVAAEHIAEREVGVSGQRRLDVDGELRHRGAKCLDRAANHQSGNAEPGGNGNAAVHQQLCTVDGERNANQ